MAALIAIPAFDLPTTKRSEILKRAAGWTTDAGRITGSGRSLFYERVFEISHNDINNDDVEAVGRVRRETPSSITPAEMLGLLADLARGGRLLAA